MFILSNILGIIFGVLGSFCVWYYLYRFLVPEIEFLNKISKIIRRGEPIYRVKFNNLILWEYLSSVFEYTAYPAP